MLNLALLTFLDNLGLTRLQVWVHTNLNLERSLFSPLDSCGSRLALGADLDDLFDRLSNALGFSLRIRDLRVLDGLGCRDLVLAQLSFLNSLLLTGFHRVVKDDLGLERDGYLVLSGVSALGLGTNADDLLGRLLSAFRGYDRVAGRLAVHELLSRSLNLSTKFTLLVNNLLASLEGVVKNNLGLERNRFLGLGYQLARGQTRTILDDARLGFLSGFFLDYLSLGALGGELRSVGLLAILTFLENPGFTRLQLRVLANLGRVRNRNLPGHILGALGRLRADNNDLVDRSLGRLPSSVPGHLLLARHALGFNLVGASRDGVIVLVLDVERNLTRRNIDNVYYSLSDVLGTVFISNCDRNFDQCTRLSVCRCSCGDLAIVVNGDGPPSRNSAQLVGVFLRDIDGFRLVEINWQRCGTTRINRLFWVRRIRLPIVGQLHDGSDRSFSGQSARRINRHGDSLLVTRLRISRRSGGDDTGVRVDLVFPSVYFLFSDRFSILISKGER